MAAIQPMEQFLVRKVVSLPPVHVPGLGLVDLSLTNSVLTMLVAAAAITLFFVASARGALVPGRVQAAGELFYDFIDKQLTGPMIGDRGRPFLPYVFALFLLLAVLNVWGIVPGQFTVTAQICITVTLAIVTFLMVVAVGLIRNGIGFFKLFVPGGVPLPMLFLVVPIEVVSFLIRPITLSMRLFGNMIGGHVVLYMFGSFVVALALWASQGGLQSLGFVASGLSLFMVVALSALEIIVALLQAFVFAALTCAYLSEVVNLDHGH